MVVFTIFYSLLVIILFFNHGFIISTLQFKNNADYVTRFSTMFGSSISTSYFLLLNVPIGILGYKSLSRRWGLFSLLSSIVAVFAIVLEQSRICFITLGLYIILYNFIYSKKNKNKI